MDTKKSNFVVVIFVVITLCLLIANYQGSKNYAELEAEHKELSRQSTWCKASNKVEYDALKICYDSQFERDCILRGYSSYYLADYDRFCCQWFNGTKICNSWSDVMYYDPILINLKNFTTTVNASILIESEFGDQHIFRIILPDIDSKYDINIYDYKGWVEIDCREW